MNMLEIPTKKRGAVLVERGGKKRAMMSADLSVEPLIGISPEQLADYFSSEHPAAGSEKGGRPP